MGTSIPYLHRQRVIRRVCRLSFITAALCLFCFAVIIPSVVHAQETDVSIALNRKSIQLDVGKSYTFKITLKGGSGSVIWSSSNKKVAVVKYGKVTAKKAGTAVIRAKYAGKTAQCKVTVKPVISRKVRRLYEKFILQYRQEYKCDALYYSYIYLNKDDIPELIISEEKWALYRIKNGSVVCVDYEPRFEVGEYEVFLSYWQKGNLFAVYEHGEEEEGEKTWILQFCSLTESKRAAVKKTFMYGPADWKDVINLSNHYVIDKKTVSRSEYKSAYERYIKKLNKKYGKAKTVRLKKHK